MAAGAGVTPATVNGVTQRLAADAMALAERATSMFAWRGAVAPGANAAAQATALVAAVVADGGTMSEADALKIVTVINDLASWAAALAKNAPMLHVAGPR